MDAAAAAWEVPAQRVLWSPLEMPRLAGGQPGRPVIVVIDADRRILAAVTAAEDQRDLAAELRPVLQRTAPE